MDVGLQRLQLFFVADAEMLLLIHDHETEIAKDDVLGQQGMRADDNIDIAALQRRFGFARFLGVDEP